MHSFLAYHSFVCFVEFISSLTHDAEQDDLLVEVAKLLTIQLSESINSNNSNPYNAVSVSPNNPLVVEAKYWLSKYVIIRFSYYSTTHVYCSSFTCRVEGHALSRKLSTQVTNIKLRLLALTGKLH